MRGLLAVMVIVGLIGCGGPSRRDYTTPREAVEAKFQSRVTIYHQVPSIAGRLLLIQADVSPAPMAVLVEPTRQNRWLAWPGYDAGPLHDVGPLAFHLKHMGDVEERVEPPGTGVRIHPQITVVYGVVNDPRITWVEAHPAGEESRRGKRVPVVRGTWLIEWPWEKGDPPSPKVSLRAGNHSGVLFESANVWDEPVRSP